MPVLSLVKRGSRAGPPNRRGRPDSTRKPIIPPIAPSRIVISKAMTTNGGIEISGLPPVIIGQSSTV